MRIVSENALAGLQAVYRYRFLTIGQYALCAKFSEWHAAEVLRTLERRGYVGHFGYTPLMGQGRTPKVYFLKRKGWELLQDQCHDLAGHYIEPPDTIWTPQMYHRLRLLDLMVAAETQIVKYPHRVIIKTLLEYRRVKGSHVRETADFVDSEETSANKLVPDGVFILENMETNRRGLFFVEMDMGTEPIVGKHTATIKAKLAQYDRYLTSGRFVKTYAEYGEFRSFLLLFVTYGQARIENIRREAGSLTPELHVYYRFATFDTVLADFFGPVWQSRDASDSLIYPLVQQ